MARSTSKGDEPEIDAADLVGPATGGNPVLGEGQEEGLTEFTDEEGTVVQWGPATSKVVQWCMERATIGDGDAAASMEAMVARVLEGTSVEAILSEEMTVDAKTILNIPILVTGFRIGETAFADGFPYYALLDCQYGNPREKHVVSVGAFKIMAQICMLDVLKEWPYVIQFSQAKKATKAGFFPLAMTMPKI